MGKRNQRTAEPIQLDVDWLLGKRADPRLRLPARRSWLARFSILLIGFFSVVVLIVAWPNLSNRWLLQELRRSLAASNGTDESLGLMVALNELGAASTRAMVEQLGSEDLNHRQAAYELLRDRIQSAERSEEWIQNCLNLMTELASVNFSSNESMHLRGLLSSVVLERLQGYGPSDSAERTKAICRALLASQMTGKVSSPRSVAAAPSDASTKVASPAGPITTPTDGYSGDSVVSSLDIPLPPLPQPSLDAPLTENAPLAENVVGPSRTNGTLSGSTNPLRGASVTMVSSESRPSPAGGGASHRADVADLAGLESLSLENLFSLLSSTQERRVRMVCDELFRRGIPTEIVEIAMDMARGDAGGQLDAMEQAVRGKTLNPVPLLAWMAQSDDRKVRHRAITLLGAMQDRDAHLKLRVLFQREPDKQLQQMIQQALVAGTGSYRGSAP